MGILNTIFRKQAPVQAASNDLFSEILRQLFPYLNSGNAITRPNNPKEYLDKSYLYNATVYSIVQKIVKKAKGVPFVLYEVKNEKAFRTYMATKGASHTKEQVLEEINDKEVENVLKYPSEGVTYNDLIEQYLIYKLILGNNYVYTVARTNGAIIGMHTIPSQIVQIVAGTPLNPILGYKCDNWFADDTIPKERIIHIKNFNPSYSIDGSHLYGLSPISNAAATLTLDNNAVNSHLAAFLNAGVRGIITPTSMDAALGKDAAIELQKRYKENKGIAKFNDIMTAPYPLQFTPLGLSPVDLAIIESQKLTLRDLCNIYSVPVQVMNSTEASTYNNMKEANKALMYDAVLPELDTWYEKLNNTFIASWNKAKNKTYHLGYDLQAVQELQSDMGELVTSLNTAQFLSVNEKRVALGYGELDDPMANEIIINGVPLSQMDIDAQLASIGGGVYE
jgi:HK97 family phage portal protein